MEHLDFQAIECPTETSNVTVAVAPDLCVGRRFLRRKRQRRGKLFLYLCKAQ